MLSLLAAQYGIVYRRMADQQRGKGHIQTLCSLSCACREPASSGNMRPLYTSPARSLYDSSGRRVAEIPLPRTSDVEDRSKRRSNFSRGRALPAIPSRPEDGEDEAPAPAPGPEQPTTPRPPRRVRPPGPQADAQDEQAQLAAVDQLTADGKYRTAEGVAVAGQYAAFCLAGLPNHPGEVAVERLLKAGVLRLVVARVVKERTTERGGRSAAALQRVEGAGVGPADGRGPGFQAVPSTPRRNRIPAPISRFRAARISAKMTLFISCRSTNGSFVELRSKTRFGVSDRSALATPACASRSRRPTRTTGEPRGCSRSDRAIMRRFPRFAALRVAYLPAMGMFGPPAGAPRRTPTRRSKAPRAASPPPDPPTPPNASPTASGAA